MLKNSILSYFTVILCSQAIGQINFKEFYPDSLDKNRLKVVIAGEAAIYAAGLSYLGFLWYADKERAPFHWYDDSRGYLQMDKFGHALGAYRESYAAYHALLWAGMDRRKALLIGGPTGLIFQTPIEIFDGMYEGWGFSWSDMAANTFGSALFTVQELIWQEQVVIAKLSYSASEYAKYHPILGETWLESLVMDYNGHTQWYSINLAKITGSKKIPPYLNIALGYSGNGMIKEFSNPSEDWYGNPIPEFERYRQFLISLDVDLSRIPTQKPWVAKTLRAFNLLKIPFPAIEFNRVDKVKGYLLYY